MLISAGIGLVGGVAGWWIGKKFKQKAEVQYATMNAELEENESPEATHLLSAGL